MNPPNRTPLFHLIAVFLLAIGAGVLFIQEPGLGDDIGYWGLAFRLHEEGGSAWSTNFHDLRWPIWGVNWVLQGLVGPGLISYYGEPVLYLALGAVLVFLVARWLFGNLQAAWLAAILFLFHPLLDGATTRPMPDLSEGFWSAAVMVCWWRSMEAKGRGLRVLFCILTGAAIFIGFANRITGLFIVPVLVILTLWLYPRRIGWLMLSGLFAALFVTGESLVYRAITGDILHSLHSNLGARGRKGTEELPLWMLPFRFFGTLWSGTSWKWIYNLIGIAGAVHLWRSGGRLGKAVVAWTVLLYIEFSCTLQGFNPPRPLVRDGDRFLASLAFPLSILAAAGAVWAAGFRSLVAGQMKLPRRWLVGALVVLTLLLAATSRRPFFDLGFIREFRTYMAAQPDGITVFTTPAVRNIAYLANSGQAAKFRWLESKRVLFPQRAGERMARNADHLWYHRKIIWVTQRKHLEQGKSEPMGRLASYLSEPEKRWFLAEVIAKNETPDFAFWQKRTPSGAEIFDSSLIAPVFDGLSFPVEWTSDQSKAAKWATGRRPIPAELRGKRLFVQITASGNTVEAVTAALMLHAGDKPIRRYSLKPYLFPEQAIDFHTIEIPAEATEFELLGRFSSGMRRVTLNEMKILVYPADGGM